MYVPLTMSSKLNQEGFETLTTPLHLACWISNDEAIRILIEKQAADVNILLKNKNVIYELLSEAQAVDYQILAFILRNTNPDINSGVLLPINQAIERGNEGIVRLLVETGKPNLLRRDARGKTPIHIAGMKRDWAVLELLINKGADPNIPDNDGNTILHYLCEGAVREFELDLMKWLIESKGMRFMRNNDHNTPFTLIKAYPTKRMPAWGSANLWKQTGDYFEQLLLSNPGIEDPENNHEIHLLIIRGQEDQISSLLDSSPESLNLRNPEGKTPLMLAIEHERHLVLSKLLERKAKINETDSRGGNNAMHIAARKGNLIAAK